MEESALISRSGFQSQGLRKASGRNRKIIPGCAGQTDLFYGDYSDLREEPQDEKLVREDKAKKVCQTCEMIWPCRTMALRTEEEYGVWGGMTPGERREFLKWFKSFYSNVSLQDEPRIEALLERWRKRHRKKQTKKEAQLPDYYGNRPLVD